MPSAESSEEATIDESALRRLGSLGEAHAGRALVFAARADRILELCDVLEAALAADLPGALALETVGFENFADTELRRMEAGPSAAQIERCVARMNDWAARHPGRFQPRVARSFVPFTPWTTLDELRINADAIRRLGSWRFEGALRARVRLSPEQPAYRRAAADGLLLESASVDAHAWRFRDAKVGAVHRALCDAHVEGPALLAVFERALDEAAGVARGKKGRTQRMTAAPNDRVRSAPMTQQITLGRHCNQACTFCVHRGDDVLDDRARAARAIQAVRAAARDGVDCIVLTGAEPTVEWYLEDLVALARKLGIDDVVLETNAKELDARALREAGVTRARVALNALDPAVSDAITRDPGGHEKTLAGLRALSSAGIEVEVSVAILRDNRGALAELVAGAIAPTIFARYVGSGPPGFVPLAIAEAARELQDAVRAQAASGVTLRAAIDGELPPCVFPDPSAVRSVLRVGRTLVERDGGRHRRIAPCEGCAAREVCPGPTTAIADEVVLLARTLRDDDPLDGVVEVTRERARVLSEYRSRVFIGEGLERRVVRLVFHCNQACDFCFVSRELPAVDDAVIEREIREVAAIGAILDLSGGEPTLNARLPDYLRLARSLGVRAIDLQTNAIKMADPAYTRALVEAGLDHAFVSLHGITAEVSDRVTAAPGTFVKTIAGIKNLRAAGVGICLNFVLCGYNVGEIAAFPDFVADELGPGIDANFSFVAASSDNVPRDTKLIPRFADVAPVVEAAYARAVARGLRWTGFDAYCGVPACYLPRAIREQYFARDLSREERARAVDFTKSAACNACDLDRRCYGVRSTYAAMYSVEELRPVRDGGVRALAGEEGATASSLRRLPIVR